MKIDVVPLTPPLVPYVADYLSKTLRHEDLYEFAAVGLRPDALAGPLNALAQSGEAHLFHYNSVPVFVWGVAPTIPGVYHLWGFGTKQTRRAMPQITRWGMKTWLPDFVSRNKPRRIEVRIPVSSVHSIGWLKKLGMRVEARLENYGIVGEDFYQLAMTKFHPKEILDVPVSSTSAAPCNRSADEEQPRHSE